MVSPCRVGRCPELRVAEPPPMPTVGGRAAAPTGSLPSGTGQHESVVGRQFFGPWYGTVYYARRTVGGAHANQRTGHIPVMEVKLLEAQEGERQLEGGRGG